MSCNNKKCENSWKLHFSGHQPISGSMNPNQIVISIRTGIPSPMGLTLNQCPAITQSSHSGGVAPGNQTTRLLLIFFLGFALCFHDGSRENRTPTRQSLQPWLGPGRWGWQWKRPCFTMDYLFWNQITAKVLVFFVIIWRGWTRIDGPLLAVDAGWLKIVTRVILKSLTDSRLVV